MSRKRKLKKEILLKMQKLIKATLVLNTEPFRFTTLIVFLCFKSINFEFKIVGWSMRLAAISLHLTLCYRILCAEKAFTRGLE